MKVLIALWYTMLSMVALLVYLLLLPVFIVLIIFRYFYINV